MPVSSAAAERCQSGLMGTPGKRVWVQAHRRFESCPLRHIWRGVIAPGVVGRLGRASPEHLPFP